jgi:hypothetical protein
MVIWHQNAELDLGVRNRIDHRFSPLEGKEKINKNLILLQSNSCSQSSQAYQFKSHGKYPLGQKLVSVRGWN